MSLFQVFITRRLPTIDLQQLESIAVIEVWQERQPPLYELLQEKIQSIDGLLCLLTDKIDKPLIDRGTSLKTISQMAVGYDNIDIAAATARDIRVGHTPGVLTEATADLTWALLMAASRHIVAADKFVRAGDWQTWEPTLLLGADLMGATLGIIGFGRIGQAVARRAQGFKMQVLYHSRHRCCEQIEQRFNAQYATLDELLQAADFVTLHLPLSSETYHLLSDRALALMKPSAILINTARGAIIDPDALYRALSTRQIAAAALDVTEPEPIALDSPLLQLDNLLITPHIGSASYQTRSKMAAMAVENLIAGLLGNPLPYCVNPE